MKTFTLARWLPLIAFIVCPVVFAQTDPNTPILRVNERVLTMRDLERVKTMLPLKRFKTNERRTKLIEAIYVRFLVQIAMLEQAGMAPVSQEDVERFVSDPQNTKLQESLAKEGFTLEGYAARRLLAVNYALFVSQKLPADFGNTLKRIYSPSPDDTAAARERAITQAFSSVSAKPSVTARAMLLDNDALARSLERRVRQGEDFARLARRYSLTRALVGGAVSADGFEYPSRSRLDFLEPELQAGIAAFGKPGLIRVSAPFGRAWLVQILEYIPSQGFRDRVEALSRPQTGLPQGTISFVRYSFSAVMAVIDNPDSPTKPPEALDPSISLVDPVVARVGNEEFRLVSWFAGELLQRFPAGFEQLESFLPQAIESFITGLMAYQGLPHNGAGAENGLEVYLAARASVSEAQLRYFYNQNRSKYLLGNDPFDMPCRFENRDYASRWRDVFLFAPFDSWAESIGYQCDTEGESDPPPLPEKPSRVSLAPIAGGYITKVFEYEKEFYFVVLYRFLPTPIPKPFALARNDVELEYRLMVARKRLPAFERELRARTGAQYLLEQGWRELEAQP